MKKVVTIGFLGTTLDLTKPGPARWSKWRPSVAIAMHEDLRIDHFILIYGKNHAALAAQVQNDIAQVSPETLVEPYELNFKDAWDFEEVYGQLMDFARSQTFDPEQNEYLIHITTGTHVAQICLFLLTEARYLPGKLLQSQPHPRDKFDPKGRWNVIDFDLSRYDSIATRYAVVSYESKSFLKSGIDTKNVQFNRLIEEIEQVAIRSRAPILLTGPTGSGKSHLAKKIYQLKKMQHQLTGPFVEVNCATIRGDGAMSALFGHRKGSFTGAMNDRAGHLKTANKGMLFLDEIGELGGDEQAMILRAIEEKRFYPVGSDTEVESDFMLIVGTNRNLGEMVGTGKFRDDLLARISMWTFALPSLAQRIEDIEPNIDFELERFAVQEGRRVTFNREARTKYLEFAKSPQARWVSNFRDLGASVARLGTFAGSGTGSGRIDLSMVQSEITRLTHLWGGAPDKSENANKPDFLSEEIWDNIDRFDRVQLSEVVKVCQESKNLSEAGRLLFQASRLNKNSQNDADRVRKYLGRFGLDWRDLVRQ